MKQSIVTVQLQTKMWQIKHKVTVFQVEEMYKKAHAAIRADPLPKPSPEPREGKPKK